MHCILLYSKKEQMPVGVFDTPTELSSFLGRNMASVASSLRRYRNGIRDYVQDKHGVKYEPFDVDVED